MASIDHLPADTLDVLVPCRRFFIKAQVTEDRQLPIVDEFVLRLIRIAERISTERLRRFFGFRDAELQAVLLDLTAASLVSLDGGDVVLTPSAMGLFQQAGPNGIPRLTTVEPWETDVWFELVSRNMMRGVKYRPAPNLLTLEEDAAARNLPEAFAREAFETNFRDFAKRIRGHPNADRLAIYAVSEVLPSGFGYQTVAAEVQFSIRDGIEFRLAFPSLQQDPLRFSRLTSAVADRWAGLQDPAASAEGVATYERLTGDSRPRNLARSQDWRDWLPLLQSGAKTGSRPIFGASYLPANSTAFCSVLFDGLKQAGKGRDSIELIWFRPGGDAWGRSNRVIDMLGEIGDTARRTGRTLAGTSLIVPRATPNACRRTSRKAFDQGILAPSGQLPADLEVILAPGFAACVVIHLPLGPRTLGIGTVLTDPDALRRIERRVRRERQDSVSLWAPSAGRPASGATAPEAG